MKPSFSAAAAVLILFGGLLVGCDVAFNALMYTSHESERCPVSPRLPEHPLTAVMAAPMGEFPVWFVTIDSIPITELGRSLPPYNGGTVRKSLVVVSTELQGDLVLTGHQLDGEGIVLFPERIDDEITNEDGSLTIVYSENDLTARKVISNAQVTTNGPNPAGYAHHPWGAYYPNPGCYALSGEYGGYRTTIIVEIREDGHD